MYVYVNTIQHAWLILHGIQGNILYSHSYTYIQTTLKLYTLHVHITHTMYTHIYTTHTIHAYYTYPTPPWPPPARPDRCTGRCPFAGCALRSYLYTVYKHVHTQGRCKGVYIIYIIYTHIGIKGGIGIVRIVCIHGCEGMYIRIKVYIAGIHNVYNIHIHTHI